MKKFLLTLLILLLPGLASAAFDHSHAQWDALTKKHVVWLPGGHASQADYKGFQADRAQLKNYLDGVSAVQVVFELRAIGLKTLVVGLGRMPPGQPDDMFFGQRVPLRMRMIERRRSEAGKQ